MSAYPEIQVIQRNPQNDENVKINMDLFGLDLSKVPNQNLKDFSVYIIPILYVITSFVSIKINNKLQENKKDKNKEEIVTVDKEEKEGENQENQKDSSEEALEISVFAQYFQPISSHNASRTPEKRWF